MVTAPWQYSLPTSMKWGDLYLKGTLVGLNKMFDLKKTNKLVPSLCLNQLLGFYSHPGHSDGCVFYMSGTGLNSLLTFEMFSVSNSAKTILLASSYRWRNIILERSQSI